MGLPQAVITILLLVSMLSTTAYYLNDSKALSRIEASNLKHGFDIVDKAWHAYRLDNETLTCSNPVEPSGCAKWDVATPGYLSASTWSTDLIPSYTLLPSLPSDFAWSYDETVYGHYFCASGTGNEVLLDAAKIYQADASAGQVIVDSSCGVTTQGAYPSAVSTWAMTYWVNVK